MKKIIASFIVLITLLSFSITLNVKASSLYFTKGEVLNNQSIVNGVKWEKYKAVSCSDKDGLQEGKQVVNVVTIDPNTVELVAWTTPGLNRTTGSNILASAQSYELANPNMMVVAAINGDYFDINGDYHMINATAMQGKVMKNDIDERFYSIGIKNDGTYILSEKGGSLPLSDEYYLAIYDKSKSNVVKIVKLDGMNQMPENGTSFFHKAKAVDLPLDAVGYSVSATALTKYDGVTYYKGNVNSFTNSLNLESETIITKDEEVARLLDSKPQIEVYTTFGGEWGEYSCVIGCPSQFLQDGNVLTYDVIGDQGETYTNARLPRTSFGFKEDGSIVFMTIDGRQSQKEMDGVTLRENAVALKNEGCLQGFNLDGGGSTTMAVLVNGELTVVNSPSDGNMRSDSDYLLAAVPRTQMEFNANYENQTLTGNIDITPLNGFTFDDTEIYLDAKATGMKADSFSFSNLTPGTHNISVYVKYLKGRTTISRIFASYDVVIEGTRGNTEPTEGNHWFEKTANGFRIYFEINDPDNLVTNVEVSLKIGNNVSFPIVVRRINDCYVNVITSKDNSYDFDISYNYRDGLVHEIKYLNEIHYDYHVNDNISQLESVQFIVNNKTGAVNECELKVVADEEYLIKKIEVFNGETLITTITGSSATINSLNITQEEVNNLSLVITYQINCAEEQVKLSGNQITIAWDEADINEEPKASSSCSFGFISISLLSFFSLVFIILKGRK